MVRLLHAPAAREPADRRLRLQGHPQEGLAEASLHLLHPAVVHFALAFAVAGAMAECAGILSGRAGLERFGSTLLLLGAAALVPAVATGYLAANTAPGMTPAAAATLAAHERAALLGAGALLVLVVWKALGRGRVAGGQRRVYAAALLVAALLVVSAALLGGRLVYDHGVGVTERG